MRGRGKHVVWTATSNFGEGLPWSFLHQMATEYLTAIGAPVAQVGYTSLLHLAVSFKFLWSPVVDLFGTKRRWLIAMQAALGAGMIAVGAVAVGAELPVFWAFLGALAILHATHDIACDGFYLLALTKNEQALYTGVRVAAFRAAMIVGSGVLVWLAGKSSWFYGFAAAGVLMILLSACNARLLPRPSEPRRERLPAGRPGLPWRERLAASAFLDSYRTFFQQPDIGPVFLFMLFYKLGDILTFAMSKPLLRDLGLETPARGVLGGFGSLATIVGSILGGALIARHGLRRTLVPLTYAQYGLPLYILLAVFRPAPTWPGPDPGFPAIAAIVLLEQFASGLCNAANVVFLMQRCRASFSASHYAFATAVVALGSTVAGALSGELNEELGHPLYFTLAFFCSFPALALVWIVPKEPIEPGSPPGAS